MTGTKAPADALKVSASHPTKKQKKAMGDIFCRFFGLCDAPADRIDRLGQLLVNMLKGFLISVMYTAEQIP